MGKLRGRPILDIHKVGLHTVEVEFFNNNQNRYETAIRKVQFPRIHNHRGAFINWNGKKVIVESLFL